MTEDVALLGVPLSGCALLALTLLLSAAVAGVAYLVHIYADLRAERHHRRSIDCSAGCDTLWIASAGEASAWKRYQRLARAAAAACVAAAMYSVTAVTLAATL
jgi:hypothetical protein